MKVGAVIPVWNRVDFLEETIESVINQIDQLVVVDDGSTDRTPELLKKLQEKYNFQLLYRDTNDGTGAAINSGVWLLEDCDWITNIDSDNTYDSNWMNTLLYECEKNPNLGVVYSGYNWGGNNYIFTEYAPNKLINNVNCFFGPSFIIRQDVWLGHRGKISHDYDKWLRVEELCWKKHLDILGIDKDLCFYRVHQNRAAITHKHQFDAPHWQKEAISRRAAQ